MLALNYMHLRTVPLLHIHFQLFIPRENTSYEASLAQHWSLKVLAQVGLSQMLSETRKLSSTKLTFQETQSPSCGLDSSSHPGCPVGHLFLRSDSV